MDLPVLMHMEGQVHKLMDLAILKDLAVLMLKIDQVLYIMDLVLLMLNARPDSDESRLGI